MSSNFHMPAPPRTDLGRLWAGALAEMVIRHPDPATRVDVELVDAATGPTLSMRVEVRDTEDQERFVSLPLGSSRLTYWPGVAAAQAWVATAWAGYLLHEGIELVTANGVRPLCPHRPPYHADHGLRTCLPPVLTPETLLRALRVVLDEDGANALVAPTPRRDESLPNHAAIAAN